MKLSAKQAKPWGASTLAWSLVTKVESEDGQITLDKAEKEVLHRILPASKLWRGKSGDAPHSRIPRVDVYYGLQLLGSWKVPINLPKKKGNETRIYMASEGFRPREGDAWFILDRGTGRLAIGWCSPEDLASLSRSTVPPGAIATDDFYQDRIAAQFAGVPPVKRLVAERYHRDARLGAEAIRRSGGACALDPTHTTFAWGKTGGQYVECHHIVPVSAAKDFPQSRLDSLENIVTLCPTCHRLVHTAKPSLRLSAMRRLLKSRSELLPFLGISREKALSYYSKNAPVLS